MYYILGILLLGWMLILFLVYFLGVGIGFIVSMYCVWFLGRRIEKFGDSIVKKMKVLIFGMFNCFVVVILGVIIMYEIEYYMVMWVFVVGIMGGYFLIVVNLGYYSMKDEKELIKS